MLKSSIWVSLFSLFVSIISFLNQIILAKIFGAGIKMDLYLFISSIPILISAVIGSSISYSLIPNLISARINEKIDFKIYSSVLAVKIFKYSSIFIIAVIIIHFLYLKQVYLKNAILTNDTINILIFSWINSFLAIFISFIAAYMNAVKKFLFPIIISLFPYLSSIILCSLFYKEFGVLVLPLSLVIGSVISLILSFYFMKDYFYLRFESIRYHTIESFFKTLPVVALAMLSFSVYQSIDAHWASKIGPSNLSYLGYCQRILVALGTLVIIGPSTVIIPRLTEAFNEGRLVDFYQDIIIIIRLILIISSVFTIMIIINSESIISIMFQRGAFTSIDTLAVANILPYMLVGMIFMLCVVMIFRIFFVKNLGYQVAALGILSSILYFSFSGVFSSYYGITGISLAYCVTWIIIFTISILVIFRRKMHFLLSIENLYFILKQFLLLTVTTFATYYTNKYANELKMQGSFKEAIIIFSSFLVGLTSYFALALTILKQKDIILILDKYKK